MKKIFLFSFIAASLLAYKQSYAAECSVRMQNAAVSSFAEELGRAVATIKILRFEMGGWTEAVGDNTGSGEVAVRFSKNINYYRVSAKQVGTSNDCVVTKIEKLQPSKIDKRALQAEKYKLAIGDAVHVSESDEEWMPFYSRAKVAKFSVSEIAQALGTSQHVELYTLSESKEFIKGYAEEDDDAAQRAKYKRLRDSLAEDFKEFRVIKVGEPDSGSLDLYILGITPDGYLVGLKTITVET